jgi:site-specific recombinase XerD
MYLHDLFENQTVPNNRYDPTSDKTAPKLTHTRKVRLTFEQINKLRRMNQVREIEQTRQNEFFQMIYAPPAAQPPM